MIWGLAAFPALAGLALWATGDGPRGRLGALAMLAAAITVALAASLGGAGGSLAWSDALTLQAALPPLAQAVAVTVPAAAFAVLLYAASAEDGRGLARLLGLLLVFVGGMELVVIAADLVTLLIGWEIVGACSWALIGHRWREAGPIPSANYAFVMTRTGDLGLFLALFATFAGTGTTGYDALGQLGVGYLAVAVAGILVAAASKAGQMPFAPWLFRAMDGPVPVSALLHSAAMVAAGVYLLARLHPQLSALPAFAPAALAVGLITAIAGGVVALQQMHAKKLLAGSTSAQMGLMIATVGAGYPGVAILHLMVHATLKAALFFSAGIAHQTVGSYDLRRMRLGLALPVAAGLTAVAGLSLAAVPPFAGGWSKEEMVKATEQAGPLLAVLAIVAGGLSAAYAARFCLLTFGAGERHERRTIPRGGLAAQALLGAATLMLSLLWVPSIHDRAAEVLGVDLPSGSHLGLVASLTAVGLGLLAGWTMARRPGDAPAADWLGLPAMIDTVVRAPFERLAKGAARFDDTAIDGQRDLAAGAVETGRGAVALVVRGTQGLTRSASRGGEALSDLIPAGSGRVVGATGADLRRLQTGLAHHYYTILVAGCALGIVILIFGG